MTTNRRPRIGGNPPQYGYLQDEHHDNSIESESDEYHTSISETGTDGAYGIHLDDDLSPQKVHNNNSNLNYNIYDTEIELQRNQKEQKNDNDSHHIFNDEDNTPSLIHGVEQNETKHSDQKEEEEEEEEEVSDTNSFHDNDRVIEINHDGNTPKNPSKYRKTNGKRNGYHKTHKASLNKEEDRIDKFLNYKNKIFDQYLLRSKGLRFFNNFRFKSKKYGKSYPIYIDKQYHTIHWICIIIMILQVLALHFIHNSINSEDDSFSIDVLSTNLYVMIGFIASLFIFLLLAILDTNNICDWSFTLSLGMVLLYLIILYTISGSLTTDKFLIYFLLTLTFNSCLGYIKFTHYIILSFIVMVEFGLCILLRWQNVITIGYQQSTINGSSYSNFESFNKQINGKITDIEFVFAIFVVVISILYNGQYIYRSQQRLCFEFIHSILITQYAKKGKMILSDDIEQLFQISGYIKRKQYRSDRNMNINNYNYGHNLHEDEYENGTIKVNGGRSEDYGSPIKQSSNKKKKKGSMNGIIGSRHHRKISTYSDEEEISKLSSLRLKVERAIQDEQDSDLDTSSMSDASNLSEPQPINTKSPKLDESIRYSLSTTNPAASNSNKNNRTPVFLPNQNASSGSSQDNNDDNDAFNVRDINEINDLMQIQDIRDKETDIINNNDIDTNKIYIDQQDDEFKDEKFSIMSLIATCKYLSIKAGHAITEIYASIDNAEHIKYSEKRSFKDIDQHWIDNRKKLTAGKNASARGLKNKKKKKQKLSELDGISSPDSDATSPFKRGLPPFIKDTVLFNLSPSKAALSLANSIIVHPLRTHFPQVKSIQYPSEAKKLKKGMVSPKWVEITKCRRSKLKSDYGEDIERELIKKLPTKWKHFNNRDEEDLIVWIEALEGIEAMTKRDRESQGCVTVLIGIADRNTKRPIAGIIHRPFTGETAVGIPEMGVWPYKFTVSNVLRSKMKSKRLVICKYNHNDTTKSYIKTNCPKYDQLSLQGGCGNNVLLLMENEADAFLHPDPDNSHKWHTCAIEAIVLALGGDFTQTDGKQYEYVDSTTRLKRGFIATLYGTKYHQQFQYRLFFG